VASRSSSDEAEQRLAEAQRLRAVHVRERRDELQERTTFRKVSFWQHGTGTQRRNATIQGPPSLF